MTSLINHYYQLMNGLRIEHKSSFLSVLRTLPEMFGELLNRVRQRNKKTYLLFSKALSAGIKLALSLRDLASGDKCLILQYDFRISWTTISKFVTKVCRIIVEEYKFEVSLCTTDPIMRGLLKSRRYEMFYVRVVS